MSRKDYIRIAMNLKSALDNKDFWYASNNDTDYVKGVKSAINALAVVLQQDNEAFDSKKFFVACGM